MSEFTLKEGIVKDLPSDKYHSTPNSYSSSQLKDAMNDIEYFHKKYILKEIEKEEIAAFDVGNYYHTGVLEPHLLKDTCIVFDGVRRGKEWEAFKLANKDKVIVTKTGLEQAENLIAATKRSTIAMSRIQRGDPEVSAFVILRVCGNSIYSPTYKKELGKYGWSDCNKIPAKGTDIWIKVRADLLGSDFVLDLKSMSGNAKDEHYIKGKISSLNYDLSASLYLDVFSLVLEKPMRDFIWTFASKDYMNCKNYMASATNILVGRAKWKKALVNIVEGIECNWQIPDSMVIIEPSHFELEILKETGETLL
jgi:hypothetical protein